MAGTQDQPPVKRYGLYALGLLLVTLAVFALVDGYPLGALLGLPSIYLFRISNVRPLTRVAAAGGDRPKGKLLPRPGRKLWILSIALVPALGLAGYGVLLDSRHGGQQVWPAWVFLGVLAVCAAVWGYVVATLMQ